MARILFICTGKSGRSRIASDIAKRYAPVKTETVCASDVRRIDDLAVDSMAEIRFPISRENDFTLVEAASEKFDLVITLCQQAAEVCPTFPGSPARIHWPITEIKSLMEQENLSAIDAYSSVKAEIESRLKKLFEMGFLWAKFDFLIELY